MSEYKCYIAEPAPTEGSTAEYWHERNYYHPETHETVPWYKLPPGALVNHDYVGGRLGPDGKLWYVKCPDGYPWMMNGPSRQGGFWNITGEAPNFTATPSIHVTTDIPNDWDDPSKGHTTKTLYHGFLTNGVLVGTSDSPT